MYEANLNWNQTLVATQMYKKLKMAHQAASKMPTKKRSTKYIL